MNSALICHEGDHLNGEGFARWLGSFSHLRLIIRISDPPSQFWKRLNAERQRSGCLGLLDVLAFRTWYRIFRQREDRQWEADALRNLRERFPKIPSSCRIVSVDSPNRPEVARALREEGVDFVIARCKRLIRKKIFSIPPLGVFVIHPGICPEYRNSHGCFWAIVREDFENVGATLLRIDEGIDTGPVLGYFRVEYNPADETHIRIQNRAVIENLDGISSLIVSHASNNVSTIVTTGRTSAAWGQPRLSASLGWRWRHFHENNRDNPCIH